MSFETYGGLLALELLRSWGAPKEQAESVCEAIVRHQDVGETGQITGVGGLVQVVTLLGKSSLISKRFLASHVSLIPLCRQHWRER